MQDFLIEKIKRVLLFCTYKEENGNFENIFLMKEKTPINIFSFKTDFNHHPISILSLMRFRNSAMAASLLSICIVIAPFGQT